MILTVFIMLVITQVALFFFWLYLIFKQKGDISNIITSMSSLSLPWYTHNFINLNPSLSDGVLKRLINSTMWLFFWWKTAQGDFWHVLGTGKRPPLSLVEFQKTGIFSNSRPPGSISNYFQYFYARGEIVTFCCLL